MPHDVSRRRFLAAGVAATGFVSAADTAAAADPCADLDRFESRLEAGRAQLDRLEAERDDLASSIERLSATIATGRNAARGAHPYDRATRAAAREVGVEARPGMAFLEMTDEVSVTTASAWFVDEHLLLTNNHNVADLTPETDRFLWTIDGERHRFEVVDRSTDGPDIALLRTAASAPTVLETGSAEDLAVGDLLVQIGNPGGFGQWVITLGELLERSYGDLVSSVPGLQGVSGSPVLDASGRVVGVTYGGRPAAEWEPGTAPTPSSLEVETYPLAPTSSGLHVAVDAALGLLEEWT